MRFTIPGTLPGLNEYTAKCRGNAYGANAMKKRTQSAIAAHIPERHPLDTVTAFPATVYIDWYEPSNRRDVDNITFSAKFILDALVQVGALPNDSRRYVCGIEHRVFTDKANPRIEVTLS